MSDRWAPKKPNFGAPPPGYVPGLGRGAIGFVTRSDIGPSKLPAVNNINTNEVQEGNYTAGQFDNWSGQKGALFAKGSLDDQDKQAEEAYDFCERRVWERNEKNRIEAEQKLKKQEKVDHSITSKFVDLKRELANVSNEQWQTIPECVDMSIKKRKRQRFAPVPDSLIVNVLNGKQGMKAIDPDDDNVQNFREAKQTVLKSKLDNEENNVTGKSNIDKIGYLTQLGASRIDSQFLGDTKKARILLKSAMMSNPKNPDIWLSAARIEQIDGKMKQCRQILRKAIDQIPKSEDLWVELSRVEKPEHSKDVLIEGLRYLPASEKLWLYAARRQNESKEMKSKILRRGLENNPTSVKLWRQLIEIEDIDEAKNLLYKAVESLPKQIDLWLALAKIENYKNAQKVLNKARKYNPLNLSIWISAARLEETQAKVQPIPNLSNKIEIILTKARDVLKKNGANISRQEWLQEALYAEKSENLVVCQMLIKITVGYGLTEDQINNILFKDVAHFEKEKESNQTTRFIYFYGIKATNNRKLMRQMIQFQNRKRMSKEYHQLDKTLQFSLEMFGQSKQFWATTINKLIKDQQYKSALTMIQKALPKISENDEQQIRLLMTKIYMIEHRYEEAKAQLSSLREKFPKGEAVFQSIRLEYELQNYKEAWKLCEKYFKESKSQNLWRLAYRIKRKSGSYNEAYSILDRAVVLFPEAVEIWKDFIELQIQQNHISKARALIDRSIQKMPKCQEMYITSIELERKFGNRKEANFSLSKALKIFPKSSQIWAIAIELEPENTRKKKASNAIEVCGQSAWINSSVGKLFWKENKLEKAKTWLEGALKLSPNNGDVWALYIRLLESHFEGEKQQALQRMFQQQQNFEGRKWRRVEQSKGGWKLQPNEILQILTQEVDNQIKALG